jgi:four helix bundle protein
MEQANYHDKLKSFMKEYAHKVYDVTENFPKGELFGTTSQLRRSALSILLNYTEGYARKSKPTMKHFYEIAYGSLKESLIIIEFTHERKYIDTNGKEKLFLLGDQIGKMLWSVIVKI